MARIDRPLSSRVIRVSICPWSAAALVAAISFGCGDIFDRPGNYTHYEDGRSALDDHVVERGVLPDWLPPDATDIHVQTELDVGHSWARFSADLESIDRILQSAPRMTLSEFEAREMSGLRGTSWWDDCAGVELSSGCEERFTYYQVSDRRAGFGYLAVDEGGHVYYWSK